MLISPYKIKRKQLVNFPPIPPPHRDRFKKKQYPIHVLLSNTYILQFLQLYVNKKRMKNESQSQDLFPISKRKCKLKESM